MNRITSFPWHFVLIGKMLGTLFHWKPLSNWKEPTITTKQKDAQQIPRFAASPISFNLDRTLESRRLLRVALDCQATIRFWNPKLLLLLSTKVNIQKSLEVVFCRHIISILYNDKTYGIVRYTQEMYGMIKTNSM